jgi:hypothetical protein
MTRRPTNARAFDATQAATRVTCVLRALAARFDGARIATATARPGSSHVDKAGPIESHELPLRLLGAQPQALAEPGACDG